MITKDVLKEAWQGVDFSEFYNDQLDRPTAADATMDGTCCCTIPNLDADRRLFVNGFGEGTTITIAQDAVMERPIQIQSVVNMNRKALVELHLKIEVGAGARVRFIHCDDTVGPLRSLSDNHVEIAIGEGAVVEYYKLQNLNDQSGLINRTFVTMQAQSQLTLVCASLNGGHICNHAEVRMQGEGCTVQADGLYLMDHEQMCDNYIFVEHAKPHCTSHALYKGIIDDQARAQFNGHVLVQDGAYKTEASQTNRNILLTDKAHVESKPFLEIYNDDVKCSHGSTTGQMDTQALYYMQTRGISERTARMMLSYAFCDEVVQHIGIESLRDAISSMVKKRLHGELTSCADCALQCSTPCNNPEVHFKIKL